METNRLLRRLAPAWGFAACLLTAPVSAPLAADRCPTGMTAIPGGTLEHPGASPERVQTFCLDRTEVTVDAYATCVKLGACSAAELECSNAATYGKKGMGNHPVNCVTWFDADNFCREHGKRLPTEDEWEWAARGGARALAYPWGADAPGARACWDGEGNDKGAGKRKTTCPVGALARGRSPDGVQDLAGNVREWTSTANDRLRVIRGGSWGDSLPQFLAASFRGFNAPDERIELVGFRCAAPVGAIAHLPARRLPKPAEAMTRDDAGVLVLSTPIEVAPRSARGR